MTQKECVSALNIQSRKRINIKIGLKIQRKRKYAISVDKLRYMGII